MAAKETSLLRQQVEALQARLLEQERHAAVERATAVAAKATAEDLRAQLAETQQLAESHAAAAAQHEAAAGVAGAHEEAAEQGAAPAAIEQLHQEVACKSAEIEALQGQIQRKDLKLKQLKVRRARMRMHPCGNPNSCAWHAPCPGPSAA